MTGIKAVIFDHTSVCTNLRKPEHIEQMRELLARLDALDIPFVTLSSDPRDINGCLSSKGLPLPAFHLTRDDIPGGKNKGSPLWVTTAAGRLGLRPHEILYVGDDEHDWHAAIHAGSIFIHARWSKPLGAGEGAFAAKSPWSLFVSMSHLSFPPPRWASAEDRPGSNVVLRALLPAGVELASDTGTFHLQDIFTYDKSVVVGGVNARDFLMLHAISSLILEGLVPAGTIWAAYPGSKTTSSGGPIDGYLPKASALIRSHYKSDLLQRRVDAQDTSKMRVKARQGMGPEPTMVEQVTTTSVGVNHRGSLKDKVVVVMDDFTTSGMSLEWARLLLLQGGASKVVQMAVGKYGNWHNLYRVPIGGTILPFGLNSRVLGESLTHRPIHVESSAENIEIMQRSFAALREGRPLDL